MSSGPKTAAKSKVYLKGDISEWRWAHKTAGDATYREFSGETFVVRCILVETKREWAVDTPGWGDSQTKALKWQKASAVENVQGGKKLLGGGKQ